MNDVYRNDQEMQTLILKNVNVILKKHLNNQITDVHFYLNVMNLGLDRQTEEYFLWMVSKFIDFSIDQVLINRVVQLYFAINQYRSRPKTQKLKESIMQRLFEYIDHNDSKIEKGIDYVYVIQVLNDQKKYQEMDRFIDQYLQKSQAQRLTQTFRNFSTLSQVLKDQPTNYDRILMMLEVVDRQELREIQPISLFLQNMSLIYLNLDRKQKIDIDGRFGKLVQKMVDKLRTEQKNELQSRSLFMVCMRFKLQDQKLIDELVHGFVKYYDQSDDNQISQILVLMVSYSKVWLDHKELLLETIANNRQKISEINIGVMIGLCFDKGESEFDRFLLDYFQRNVGKVNQNQLIIALQGKLMNVSCQQLFDDLQKILSDIQIDSFYNAKVIIQYLNCQYKLDRQINPQLIDSIVQQCQQIVDEQNNKTYLMDSGSMLFYLNEIQQYISDNQHLQQFQDSLEKQTTNQLSLLQNTYLNNLFDLQKYFNNREDSVMSAKVNRLIKQKQKIDRQENMRKKKMDEVDKLLDRNSLV